MIDFKKDPLYKATPTPAVVDVPAMTFVTVDGTGAPDAGPEHASQFQDAMQIIYGVAYTVKFWDKKYPAPKGYDKFTMPPLEALWWMKSGQDFDMKKPNDWCWTAMHRLPEFVTPAYFKKLIPVLIASKKSDIYQKAKLTKFAEGKAVQILHIGPYDQEGPNIAKLHAFATENGLKLRGKHHELYFGDPRRTDPKKLKTILRQPVA